MKNGLFIAFLMISGSAMGMSKEVKKESDLEKVDSLLKQHSQEFAAMEKRDSSDRKKKELDNFMLLHRGDMLLNAYADTLARSGTSRK